MESNPTLLATGPEVDYPLAWEARPLVPSELPRSIEEGADFFRSLHLLTLDLGIVPTLKDLYREAVTRGKELLDLDRMAVLLYDPDLEELTGTFGTNEHGVVVDEGAFRAPVDATNRFLRESLAAGFQVAVWDDMDLTDHGAPVGRGWNAMATLWDGDRPFGLIAVDNLLRRQPLQPLQRQLLGLYGSILGGLILRKRDEEARAQGGPELPVDQRVELERMASLGQLVAGVYHEVSTPLGNALLAASFLDGGTAEVQAAVASRTLGQKRLEDYLKEVASTARILTHNLGRARTLIENFKLLAVNQADDDKPRFVNLRETLEAVTVSHSPRLRQREVSLHLAVDPNLTLVTYPGALEQIITNLVGNSLTHGFDGPLDGRSPTITLEAFVGASETGAGGPVVLEYRDNGKGIDPTVRDTLFDPYVTTRRDRGGSGLGMSIVRSLVTERLGGSIDLFVPAEGGAGFRIVLPPRPPTALAD